MPAYPSYVAPSPSYDGGVENHILTVENFLDSNCDYQFCFVDDDDDDDSDDLETEEGIDSD